MKYAIKHFAPDIFSRSRPGFVEASPKIQKVIQGILNLNYAHVVSKVTHIKQLAGNELNSKNYKIVTPSQLFLLKSYTRQATKGSETQMRLLRWLGCQKAPVPCLYTSISGDFIVYSKTGYSQLMNFIEGNYFSGEAQEIPSLARSIRLFFRVLKRVPPQLWPSTKILPPITMKDKEIFNEIKLRCNEWGIIFGSPFSTMLSQQWDVVEKTYSEIVSLQNKLSEIPYTLVHIDLHPHNVLFKENNVAAFLDIDSCLLAQEAVVLGFTFYKLARQIVVKHRNDLRLVSKLLRLFYDLLSEGASIEGSYISLKLLAKTEVLRRILIIFDLCLKKNYHWIHVLPIHLAALKESDSIFSYFK